MRLLNSLLILTVSTMLASPMSFADTLVKRTHAPVVFQVIQDQLNIDKSMIKDASVITNNDGTYGGLQIELTPSASKELTQLTSKRVGKLSNLVLNDTIVITATLNGPFAHKFIVAPASINKEDAQVFVDSLKNS